MTTVDATWIKEISILKSLGFEIIDPNELQAFEETNAEDIVMVEKEYNRRQFVFVLLKPNYEGEKNFDFYVQQDVACGYTNMPVAWNEIDRKWIEYFKYGFEGYGFNGRGVVHL